MKCPSCQTENQNSSRFCINCGGSLAVSLAPDDGIRRSPSAAVNKRYAQDKSPGLAAVLSFLIVGLGQVYNGDVLKGAVLFVGFLVLSFTVIGALGIWGFGIYDAYQVAKGNKSIWK